MDITASAGRQPPEGFYYISQENYYIANLNHPHPTTPETYLYSDSATSCIIVIVRGTHANGDPIVALSHLGGPRRFLQFFQVIDQCFVGPAAIYAQGANPPFPTGHGNASLQNTQTLLQWLSQHTNSNGSKRWYVDECTLSLGQGLPQQNNQDCYGIDLQTLQVSNQRFHLTNEQRDPTGGAQTLYCIFGMEVQPSIPLARADAPFTSEQMDRLVAKAKSYYWPQLLQMEDADILAQMSSTPDHEVPWFVETLRNSAQFVLDYNQND